MLKPTIYSLGNDILNAQLLRNATAIAVESLSWMELEGLSERLALVKTTQQLGIRHPRSMRMAFLFIVETTRALNLVDRIARSVMPEEQLEDLDLGVKNFLRVFIWWTILHGSGVNDASDLLEAGRHVLGWRELKDLELVFGKVLTFDRTRFMRAIPDPEQTALSTFNRTWFVSYCYRTFGRGFALDLLKGTLSTPPTYIRINAPRNNEQLIDEIERERVKIRPVERLDGLFQVVRTERPLTLTKSYQLGYFSIQDKSSYLAAIVADPKKNDMILDLCAAPGGKTSHIAVLTENSATICSVDISHRRMSVWKREMQRCKILSAVPIIADGRSLPIKQTFDLVFVDPPCTNSGAYGKTPSLKWRLTPNSLTRLAQIQWGIINTAVQVVKPGGHLIYSTCSVTLEENELQIERLLKINPQYKLEEELPFIGHEGLRGLNKCQRLYPNLDNCNGYFISSLKREY
jgi:16S rRNA (cytosine967-C5)-methyltransferase